MKIGEPIKELPPTARRRSRYSAVWAVVEEALGRWVPVECDSQKARRQLQCAAGGLSRTANRPKMQTVSDVASLTLYIRVADGGKA